MSELSEKLKTCWEHAIAAENTLDRDIWLDRFEEVCRENSTEIIAALESVEHDAKCVQFAEDMQKLVESGQDPAIIRGRSVVWIDGVSFTEKGPDIFTAARKAVLAMEGE